MSARANWLSGGRLHLHHGPIDLIVEAWGERAKRARAYAAAALRFAPILDELVGELERLKSQCPPEGLGLRGAVARRMEQAVLPFARDGLFITPMAAVAGAVAEEVLSAMLAAAPLDKAYVNNGGDIALHLVPGECFAVAVMALGPAPMDIGRVTIAAEDGVCGIATSGRGGRSLSLGIADSVTVLARTAAMADAAATLVANAVDLPGHPAIERRPARAVRDDSDLGDRLVVTGVGALSADEVEAALARGARVAEAVAAQGLLSAAALFLNGRSEVTGYRPLCAAGRLPAAAVVDRRSPLHA
jgi:hypothetical protein